MIHAREGIRFNSLCPSVPRVSFCLRFQVDSPHNRFDDVRPTHRGPLKTPLLMDFLNTPEKLNRRLNHLPMGRFGEAIEQAKAVLFRESLSGGTLCSNEEKDQADQLCFALRAM